MKTMFRALLILLVLFTSCSKDENKQQEAKQLTIFFVNDAHGQLENFSKVKQIIDQERQEHNVIVACSGDIFPAIQLSTMLLKRDFLWLI